MWLSDFHLVLPDRALPRGALRVEDGRIAEVRDAPVAGAAVEGGGLMLLPGFVDMHGDMIERQLEPRPGVRMPVELGLGDLDRGLAAAGVTTAYAAVSFSPSSAYGHLRSYQHTTAMIRDLRAAAPDLLVDHRVHCRFEVTYPQACETVEALVDEGAVDLLSLNDHTPGQGQYRDVERYVASLQRNQSLSYAQAVEEVETRIAERSQPAEALARAIEGICALCTARGVIVASHDDDTAEKVALMAGFGARISEFPVTMAAAAAARARGLAVAMGAPNALRGLSYSGNLSARDACGAGLLDMLASDYHPSAMLPAVLALAGRAGLPAAVALASANPARALGIADRGAIAPGRRADLVVADPAGVGRVRATLRAGRVIYSDGWPEGR